jgi:DNA recombination protein RmuC
MTIEQLLLVAVVALGALVLALVGYLLGSRGRVRRAAGSDAPVSLPAGLEALAPAFQQLQQVNGQLNVVQGALAQLRESSAASEARAEARLRVEDQAFDSLQRLSATLLGSARAGATGERLVADALKALPPQWLVTDHKVANKKVEYAIRLPDDRVLPIDSKVVAQAKLEQLDQTTDPAQRKALEKDIQGDVLRRASEVRKYLDGHSTSFAIAAVSDAAYSVSGPILSDAYTEHQVIIVPYSLLLPFLLLTYEQHRHTGVDLGTNDALILLRTAENHVKHAVDEVEGRLSTALTQYRNGYEELNQHLSGALRTLRSIQSTTGEKVGANGRH